MSNIFTLVYIIKMAGGLTCFLTIVYGLHSVDSRLVSRMSGSMVNDDWVMIILFLTPEIE